MAVELCKVSLWLESNSPGRPLSFLDHRIVCGNSLLGTTPALLADGIPDTAFKSLTCDDLDHVKALRKRNKDERKQRHQGVLTTWNPATDAVYLAEALRRIDAAPDDTAVQVAAKQAAYDQLQADAKTLRAKLLADAWCAAFVALKTRDASAVTDRTLRLLAQTPAEHVRELIAAARDPGAAPDSSVPLVHDAVTAVLNLTDAYQFTHLHLTFPEVFRVPEALNDAANATTGWSGGFDAIVSNPPWERVKLQEKEFFAQHDEAIATAPTAAARKQLIAELKSNNPSLRAAFETALRHAEGTSALLRHSQRFPLAGRGDVNTYTVFIELMKGGISPTGRVGAIVPTGIATDDTTKHLFGHLVENQQLASLYDFENRRVIFPGVHRNQKFCLLTLTGTQRTAAEANFAFFALDPADLDDTGRQFTLNSEDFSLLNPNTKTCPIFRTVRDAEITKRIYRRLPVLINESDPDGNPWNISLQAMFHMANDSGLFRTGDELESREFVLEGNRFISPAGSSDARDGSDVYLPLYEGKMATFFDHRAADVFKSKTAVSRQNQADYLSSEEKQDPNRQAQPLYWVQASTVRERISPDSNWNLGFNDVTSSTNGRTVVCTALPLVAVGHSEPIIHTPNEPGFLLVALNSFVLDYTARQKVGGNHLTFGIIKQLPVVCPHTARLHASRITPAVLELSYTAWDMAQFGEDLGYHGPPFRWDEERRSLIRAELDALMFHLYGVNRDDVAYIMDTFPIVKRQDEEKPEELRTKRLILERYDAMATAFEATHGTLNDTPSGASPPMGRSSLAAYSRRLAQALHANYKTVLDPPPGDPRQAHPASPRPYEA